MNNNTQSEQLSEIQDILEYLDTVLYPIISLDYWDVYSKLYDMISILPSTQQWTPCSERPPKDGSEVLVTTSWNDVCKGWYSNGIWRNEYDDGEILAWMPLPKPWKKRRE